MAATMQKCVWRSVRILSVLCRTSSLLNATYNARTYVRVLRRYPIRVFTSEEAVDAAKAKPKQHVEDSQYRHRDRVRYPPPSFDGRASVSDSVGDNRHNVNDVVSDTTRSRTSINGILTATGVGADHISTQSKTKSKMKSKAAFVKKGGRSNCENDNVNDNNQAKFNYIKLHKGDERFSKLVMAAKSRKLRVKKGVILLEGWRLIVDAVDAGVTVQAIYFCKLEELNTLASCSLSCQFYKVEYSQMKIWSDVATPPGLMAVCTMPKVGELVSETEHMLPITFICDNIRDPGNMGTILRSAGAAGCKLIIALSGCVDIWEPKVLRAGAGVHFRTHILSHVTWPLVSNYLSPGDRVYLADMAPAGGPSGGAPPADVVGRIASYAPAVHSEVDETSGVRREVDESYADREHVQLFSRLPLSTLAYTAARYAPGGDGGGAVLVIGGETHGLSAEARKLAFERNGDVVYVPMAAGVNSLNSSTAASVILFEMQRQFLQAARDGGDLASVTQPLDEAAGARVA